MVEREIINIDEEKCTGCGECIPACPEGALQVIDGKARLISDLFCDGLGACIGECPEDAITVEKREAEPYDEEKVMENIIEQGENTIKAHLEHLQEHGEEDLLQEALEVLEAEGIENPLTKESADEMENEAGHSGCPGAQAQSFGKEKNKAEETTATKGLASKLEQWPVQLHLVPPAASYFQGTDVVLAADCVAYSVGDFHAHFLEDKSLAIACPKLDRELDYYQQKLIEMIDEAEINTLTVLTMEVPCCRGLLKLAREAAEAADRKLPVKSIEVSIQGEILNEKWVDL